MDIAATARMSNAKGVQFTWNSTHISRLHPKHVLWSSPAVEVADQTEVVWQTRRQNSIDSSMQSEKVKQQKNLIMLTGSIIQMYLQAAAVDTAISPFYFLFLSGDAENTRHFITVILKTKRSKENERISKLCGKNWGKGTLPCQWSAPARSGLLVCHTRKIYKQPKCWRDRERNAFEIHKSNNDSIFVVLNDNRCINWPRHFSRLDRRERDTWTWLCRSVHISTNCSNLGWDKTILLQSENKDGTQHKRCVTKTWASYCQ